MAEQREIDALTGVETTGHEWDGVKELKTPLPRWWVWIFWITILWAVGYWIAMPAWPLVQSYTAGVLGYSSRSNLMDSMAEARAAQKVHLDKLAAASLEQVRTDPGLLEFALSGGRSAFAVHCSQCHGSGAQGFKGYPNLNDDEWLWGGTLDNIHFTITHGIRNETDDDARVSDMPAFLKDGVLDANQIDDVAEYVLSLSDRAKDAQAAERGRVVFAEQCVACHGEQAIGDPEFGAPGLTDPIWLYGGDKASIVEIVSNSRGGVMPAWGQILDPATVKTLAVYVHSLGGGN